VAHSGERFNELWESIAFRVDEKNRSTSEYGRCLGFVALLEPSVAGTPYERPAWQCRVEERKSRVPLGTPLSLAGRAVNPN
jgi:hypothetical protein